MSKKPETIFREKVSADLADIPGIWVESIQQKAIRGTPDMLVCFHGYFVALELKKSNKDHLEPLQRYKKRIIEECGGLHYTVNPQNWKQIRIELEQFAIIANKNPRRKLWESKLHTEQ